MVDSQVALSVVTPLLPAIAISHDGRRRIDVSDGVARLEGRVLAEHVEAVAMVDGAIWLLGATGDGHVLRRFDAGGSEHGAPVRLDGLGHAPVVSAARTGARVALIEGTRAVVVRERDRELELDVETLEPNPDRRVLLAGRGVFERSGGVLLPRKSNLAGLALPHDLVHATVVGGALALDASTAVVELDARGVHYACIYGVRRGELRLRIRIGEASILAVAERAGHFVIGRDRHLAVVDMRTGQCANERLFGACIASVATTAGGDRFLVAHEDGTVAELGPRLSDLDASTPSHEVVAEIAGSPRCGADAQPAAPVATESIESIAPTEPIAPIAPTESNESSEPIAPTEPNAPIAPFAPMRPSAREMAPVELPRPTRPTASMASDPLRAFLEDTFELVSAWCATARAGDDAAVRAAETAAQHKFARWNEQRTPLHELGDELGLSSRARTILIIAAAPRLWGELAPVYGRLAADPARPMVDELLVCQLLELERGDRRDVTRELDASAPLIRHGAISIGRGQRPFAALEVADVVLRRLSGDRFLGDAAGSVIRRAATVGASALHAPREAIAAALRWLDRPSHGSPARIAIRGRLGAGRRTTAAALAAHQGRELGLVELSMRSGGEPSAELERALLDAHLRGFIPCVSGLDCLSGANANTLDEIRAVLDGHPGPVVVRCEPDAIAPLAPGHLVIDLGTLPVAERATVWRDALAAHALSTEDAPELAERYTVGPGTIHRIAAQAAESADAPDAARLVDQLLQQRRAERLARYAERIEHLPSWHDLVLPDEMIDSVRELVARARLRAQVLETWGLHRIASTGRAITALLQGGPGTGKTMVAGVIARELGFDLYRVDLSRITSKWIGETEKNLAEVFAAAEDGQCILLFDEADALFGKRTDVKSSQDRNSNLEVNYLLQRLDSFEGIAILTTNFGASIDPAFKRRLAMHLQFPFPDQDERERLWRAHLPSTLPIAGELHLAELARSYELSGGYIRNAVLRAAYLAAGEGSPVTKGHLERAVAAEYRDRAKISSTGRLE